MKLSILICSHVKREPLLKRMLAHLASMPMYAFPPHNSNGRRGGVRKAVEVLIEQNSSPQERPASRNKLLDRTKAEYCAFVDDDDVLADDYIPRVLKALESHPDICSICGNVVSLVDYQSCLFDLSIKHEKVFSLPMHPGEDGVFRCFSSHLNPIRTRIARAVRFPEGDLREDNAYTMRLREYYYGQAGGRWNEAVIPGVIYHYFNRARILK